MTKSLVNMVIESVNTYLTEVLQTNIDTDDATRAGLVRPGLLQDDPTRPKVSVLTFPNDPSVEGGWRNEIVVPNGNGADYNPPPYELGGGEMWYYRFTTELDLFWRPKVKRDEARVLASIVLSRASRAISLAPIASGEDDFGETPIQLRLMKSELVQGGGEGQFIFYGKLFWQCLVGRNL